MKGILFTPENIKAIREYRKTQTRRLMTPQPMRLDENNKEFWTEHPGLEIMKGWVWDKNKHSHYYAWDNYGGKFSCIEYSARYQVGEVVYIKEAWGIRDCGFRVPLDKETWAEGFPVNRIMYGLESPTKLNWFNKRSPLFMPAWAARSFIQITDVRAERLQEITEEDAMSEGVDQQMATYLGLSMENYTRDGGQFYRHIYSRLWDSINKKHPWSNNDWIFAYSFTEVKHAAN